MSNSPIIFDPKNYQTIQGTQPTYLQEKKKTDTTFGEDVKDFGLSIGKGITSIPEAAIGLSDAVTTAAQINSSGRAFRDTADSVGLKAREWGDNLSQMQSEGYRAKQQEFDKQDGFLDKVAYGIKNPTLITNAVGESLPSMVVGGSVGKGVGKGISAFTGRKVSDTAAAAIGEGSMMAGQQAANIQKESNGLTTGQALASLGTGAIGGGLGMFGGKVADKMGLADADTYIVAKMGGKKMVGEVSDKAAKWTHVPNSVVKGALSEGLLEELPQSLSEQIIQNLATDKHWSEGLDSSAAMGVLAGGSMGGAFGGASGLVDYQASKKAVNQLAEQQAANAESENLIAQQPESDSFAGDNNISENIASSQNLSSNQFDDSAEARKQQAQDVQSSQSIINSADNSFSDNADNQVDLPAIESNSASEIQTQEPVANVLPSEEMGLSRSRGSLEAAAATAVDTIAPQTELSSSAPDSIPVSSSSGLRGSSGRKAPVLGGNTAPTISAPESSNIAPIPQSYTSAADVQPVAPITIADADRSNRNGKIRTKDIQQTRELLSKENRQIFDSLPSYLQRDIEIFSEYSADVQRRKESGLPDARSHYPAYVGLAAQRVSEVMNRDKSGQLQKLIGSANRVAYGHRSTYGWSQPLPMGAEAAADAFQPVAAKKAAKVKQAANAANPIIGSAANQQQEAVQQQAPQEQVQTATQSAPETATLSSQLQSAPATDSIQQAQKQNPLDNLNDLVKADYNTLQNQIRKHREEGNTQALKQSEMQLRKMRSKVYGFESAAQSFVAGDIDSDTFFSQSEGFQKAATKIIQAQQEQNAEAVMQESRAEQQEQSVQASEQAKQEAPAQIDPIEPIANRKDGKENLSAKGWWNNQPDNVSVYLVGKSRGKDTLKVTENDDGSFDAQIAIAGVGGEISKASRKQLNDWVKARLNKPNGEQLSLKKVKAATKAANQDSKKFSRSAMKDVDANIRQAVEQAVGKHNMRHIEIVAREEVARPDNAEDLVGAQGWYDPKTQRITLIAEALPNQRTAQFVAWHELGHRKIDVDGWNNWQALFRTAYNGNPVIKQVADNIFKARKGAADGAALNKFLAVEEAVADLYAAHKTGDYAAFEQRNGVKVPQAMRHTLGGYFARMANHLRTVLAKVMGVERKAISDAEIYGWLKKLDKVSDGLNHDKLDSRSNRNEAAQRAIEQGFTTEQQWEEIINEKIRQGGVVEQGGQGGDNRGVASPSGRVALKRFFHGTRADIDAFDLNHGGRKDHGWLGTGVYLTDNPVLAEAYAEHKGSRAEGGQNIMPLAIRLQNPFIADKALKQKLQGASREDADRVTAAMRSLGHDGVILKLAPDAHEVLVFNPADVRSVHAAFDSEKAGENGLLFSRGKDLSQEERRFFNEIGELEAGMKAYNKLAGLLKPAFAKIRMANTAPEQFTQMMRDYRAQLNVAGRTAKTVADAGVKMTEAERKLLADVLEKELPPGVEVSPELQELAGAMREILTQQSDDLVALEMLSEASRERFKDTYLPRLYAKHITGDTALDALNKELGKAMRGALGNAVKGQHLKGRGLFKEVKRGEQTAYEADGWEMRHDYGNKGKKAGVVVMWRDYTREERDAMMRYVDVQKIIEKVVCLEHCFDSDGLCINDGVNEG